MLSSLKYLIAGRYVRSPKSHSVINMISAVSIVAMAIPVAAIILLLSIFNGLERMALDNLKSVDSDLSITPREGTTFRVEELPSALLDDLADVEQYSFILEQSALAQMGASRAVVQVRGVDEGYTSVVPVAKNILVGEFTTRAEENDYVVAAHGVMQDLSSLRTTAIGESMQLYAINRTRISTLLPVGGYTRRELPIAGIYSIDEDNRSLVITSLKAAQSLFNYADRASAVEIRLREGASPQRLAEQLQAAVGEHFDVRTREERNSIYRLMAIEKWGVFCIAVLVMIVASLSIVGTLVMVIIDKRDDVRTLRTMGARRDFVRDIFTAEGLLMALLSLVLGLVLGAGLALLQQHFGFVGIDAQTLQVNAYPVEVHLQDILLTVVAYAAVSYIVVKLTVRALMRDNI
ncbi:MAG: ABC transporter permease [Alistipes sp.]|nr:ABC transporter permease [Alistipes sp.]MBQ5922709.1 ABC transporter permease [Alistipes sp.]